MVELMQTEFITSLTECKQRRQPPGLAAVADCTGLYSQDTLKEQFTQKCTKVQSPKLCVESELEAGSCCVPILYLFSDLTSVLHGFLLQLDWTPTDLITQSGSGELKAKM